MLLRKPKWCSIEQVCCQEQGGILSYKDNYRYIAIASVLSYILKLLILHGIYYILKNIINSVLNMKINMMHVVMFRLYHRGFLMVAYFFIY